MKKSIISFYRKNKKTILLILRIAISASLIIYLVSTQIESFSDIIEILKSSNKFLLLLSLSTHALGTYITAVRWKTLLNTQGVKLSNMTPSSTVLTGSFFNNFLPTSIGGDVFRAYDASKKGNISLGSSASVILVERFSGVVSAATYAIIALFLGFTAIGHQSVIVPIVIFFIVSLILGFLIINPSLFRLGKTKTSKFRFVRKISDKLSNVYNTLISFKKYKLVLVEVLIFSFPVVAVIAMIPISIGGIGLRENSLVIIMVAMGVNNEKAALFSLIILFMLIIMGVLGGVIYIIRPHFTGRFKRRV